MARVCVLSGRKDFTNFCVASLMCSCKIDTISTIEEIELELQGQPLILIIDNSFFHLAAEQSQTLCSKNVYILVIMEYQTIEAIVQFVKNGVHDVLEYPCSTIKLFTKVQKIQRCIHVTEKKKIFGQLEMNFCEGCTESEDILRRFSKTDLPILLLGETGTGKSFCAKKIVSLSKRKNDTFLEVNCSTIPESLAELQFFGSTKGAFTDADYSIGYLEKANNGTLFLDEVGELPYAIQGKLLKVLDDGVFYKLGSTQPIRVDIRYLFATNRDLRLSIMQGAFRRDFFNRINAVQFYLPPLKNHKQKINHYINLFITELGKTIAPELRDRLSEYEWPGNIRELKNYLSKLSHLSQGNEIRLEDLQSYNFI